MSATYVLTKAAAADLREIVRYTRKQWGDDQLLNYVSLLKNGIEQLVANKSRGSGTADKSRESNTADKSRGSGTANNSVGRDLSELYPRLCVLHCQHHYIFCLPRDGAPTLIVAIFHERMDLIARVAKRLL